MRMKRRRWVDDNDVESGDDHPTTYLDAACSLAKPITAPTAHT